MNNIDVKAREKKGRKEKKLFFFLLRATPQARLAIDTKFTLPPKIGVEREEKKVKIPRTLKNARAAHARKREKKKWRWRRSRRPRQASPLDHHPLHGRAAPPPRPRRRRHSLPRHSRPRRLCLPAMAARGGSGGAAAAAAGGGGCRRRISGPQPG